MTNMEKNGKFIASAEKTHRENLIFEGKILRLFCDDVTLPSGKLAKREYVRHRGAVAVVALDDKENVYLVKQYRYAIGRETLEIPAGKLEVGEHDPREAAERELSEELGITANTLEPMGVYISSPAILTERIYCFLATGLHFGSAHPDDDEYLGATVLPLADAVSMVLRGEIEDGKTLFALQKAFLMRHSVKD